MRIMREQTALLLIDVQQRLLPMVEHPETLMKRLMVLMEGLELLDIPVVVTEQYPKGLGETVERLQPWKKTDSCFEKVSFSCLDNPEVRSWLGEQGRKQVVVVGIEAHVCVLQTVIDLLEAGYQPVVVHDCVSSRHRLDMDVALERMRREGAVITTVESLLFELTRTAGTDLFKGISALVKY